MIAMQVRHDQVIDARQVRELLGGLEHAAGVAAARIARVDQHRLAGRRHDERRGAALDVDPVDLQRTGRLRAASVGRDDDRQRDEQQSDLHGRSIADARLKPSRAVDGSKALAERGLTPEA